MGRIIAERMILVPYPEQFGSETEALCLPPGRIAVWVARR